MPIEKNVTSSSRGEFWRLLVPGDYLLFGYKDMCHTAGVILASTPSPLTVSPTLPLVRQDLVLNSVLPCNSAPLRPVDLYCTLIKLYFNKSCPS